ncbi:MAG: prolyl oligopeptidase family serine peptidase, partial [Rhodothermales bacterium]
EFQLFAAQGYGIVYSNPRGSGGYGYAFKRGNYQDWGDGPAADVLAAADSAATEPWVDPDRQVVTGGSYAGYLTAWIVGHDGRFQAAVAQRGVYDLATFLGEGNAWRLIPGHFGGYPWDAYVPDVLADSSVADTMAREPLLAIGFFGESTLPPDDVNTPDTESEAGFDESVTAPLTDVAEEKVYALLRRNSPLTYVDSIRTPLLIMHSDSDLRTGVIQSEMLYKSLKILGRPVEYVRYPEAGHDLSRTGDPKQRLDRLLRIYEFMERYVGEESTVPVASSPASE